MRRKSIRRGSAELEVEGLVRKGGVDESWLFRTKVRIESLTQGRLAGVVRAARERGGVRSQESSSDGWE